MRTVCENLKAHVPEIIAHWDALTQEEPWMSLPEGHRLDGLPDVAIGLFEAALCDPSDPASHEEKVEAAVKHGAMRRARGLDETVLLSEHYLLREAIWRYLKETFPPEVAGEAILRIDSAIMLATRATLLGYYRTEFESRGTWPAPIEHLVEESPLLRLARVGDSDGRGG